jgi:hypothetical protein
MKSKDLILIRKYLEEYKKDQLDYERILKYADIDIPLQHLCGENEDAKEVRARILKQTQEKIADIERLQQLLMDETLNADFHCADGKVIFD